MENKRLELSIEEKAKRFDEVLNRAKECIIYVPNEEVNKYMFSIFPELAESKDLKIRKLLIDIINVNSCGRILKGVDTSEYKDCIDWIEKYGEQNSDWNERDELMRKEAINVVRYYGDYCRKNGYDKCYTADKIIEWLEKLKR